MDHGYVPTMIDEPNPDRWQSRKIENELRKEFAGFTQSLPRLPTWNAESIAAIDI